MLANFDLLAVGNATIDAFLTIKKSNRHFRLDKKTKEICIRYGDKAIVDKVDFLTGGNAANVVVGAARMGFKAGIAAEIGADEFTQKIVNNLKKESVSEILLKQTMDAPCPFSVVINFKKERTIFAEDVKREHDFNFEGISAKWVYLTSLGDKWREAYRRCLIFVKNTKSQLAFNPGTLQIDSGEESIMQALKETAILFVNKEEAIKITGLKTEDILNLLKNLNHKGVKTAIITDGEKGAFLYNQEIGFVKKSARRIRVLEKTGAGDAFASGFLSAIMANKSLKEAMTWGSLNAESVITKTGAQAGLLTRKEIEKRLC